MRFRSAIRLTVAAALPATAALAIRGRSAAQTKDDSGAVPSLNAAPPRLVLLDRDGVINEDVGSPGVTCPSQLRLTPGAGCAIGSLRRSGCRVALVTNQSCVGKGLVTESELDAIHDELRRMLVEEDADAVFDGLYACTSVREDNDPRMKPQPGMVLEACADFGVGAAECVFVGDTVTDLEAAWRGGVERRILVSTGYGYGHMGRSAALTPTTVERPEDAPTLPASVMPFVYATNLFDAVSFVLKN